MFRTILLLVGAALLVGCASTVQSRKQERSAAYASLSAEDRTLVDQGKIRVGMSMDAVYIAWGKPHEVLRTESSAGTNVVWRYIGSSLEPYRYWGYRSFHDRYYGFYPSPTVEVDYVPVYYPRAEVVFENGVVKEWKSMPEPGGY